MGDLKLPLSFIRTGTHLLRTSKKAREMRLHLTFVVLFVLIAAAAAQLTAWEQPVGAHNWLRQSAFPQRVSDHRAYYAQASTCPYVVTPVAIPATTLEAIFQLWKSILDQQFSDPTFGMF